LNKLIAAAALFLMLGGAAKAAPIDVSFSFNAIYSDGGASTGEVTGELVFAAAGTGVAATGLYIYTAPSGTLTSSELNFNFLPPEYDYDNSFTVSASGAVTSALLDILDSDNVQIELNESGTDAVNNFSAGGAYTNAGLSGITFNSSSTSSTVPEPASLPILGSALLALAMLRRREQA